MDVQLNFAVTLTKINCGDCGGTYAINERYRRQKQEVGGFWNCPYCKCSWGFTEGENTRLKRELEQERKRKEWAQQEAKLSENRRRAAVGQVTKIKNRVAKGVCPCCNRTFQNLMKHMKTQHPDFKNND